MQYKVVKMLYTHGGLTDWVSYDTIKAAWSCCPDVVKFESYGCGKLFERQAYNQPAYKLTNAGVSYYFTEKSARKNYRLVLATFIVAVLTLLATVCQSALQ